MTNAATGIAAIALNNAARVGRGAQAVDRPSDFLSVELSLTLDRINNSTAMELQRIRRLAKSAFRNPAFNPYDDLLVGFGIQKEERRQRRDPGRPEDNYHDIEPIE